ncbi:MAG: TatD family hydrolase [Kiritimatiellae bacterium]|nr:TatD family hydrolase [Kiritimatiellia bacterium]
MNLFDTHAHFTGSEEEISQLLRRAREAGVTRVLAVGGSDELNKGVDDAFNLTAADASLYPKVYKAIGFDRDQINSDPSKLDFTGASAVGEIGLDYYYSLDTREAQLSLMGRELELSRELNLPVIIHTREADDDTLGILREIPSRGIIHSFTGNPTFCKKLLDLGYYISLSGIVTFRAADNVRETAKVIPLDRILIETDTPYLAPVPKRGQPNEPAFVMHTAKFLAEFLGVDLMEFISITAANALEILASSELSR